jgi:hypothetical protein
VYCTLRAQMLLLLMFKEVLLMVGLRHRKFTTLLMKSGHK